MTREDFLDQYYELTNQVLPEIAIRMARGDNDEAADLLTKLQAKQSDMWTSYSAQASAAVAP